MKLVQASCDCGFITQKARAGYHFHQWWFPRYAIATGALTDVYRSLPDNDHKRIDQHSIDLFAAIPHTDLAGRREVSADCQRLLNDVHSTFITREFKLLSEQYASQNEVVFNPAVGDELQCPRCGRKKLSLVQVKVIASCKADCGQEYPWRDSEEIGCPKCGYRPHRFRTEIEDSFVGQPRTICSCPCSSTVDCTSHVDGYCPKCGRLPNTYRIGGKPFCGMHHQPMQQYHAPGNFLFIESESRCAASQFPNAKFWGDAPHADDGIALPYCPRCESDQQRWLRSQVPDDT